MAVAPGTRLGAYEILGLLGSGGMGEVYRARDLKLGRDVAIKVLPQTLHDDPERLARFEREARTLAALNHPNIAHIHGFEDSTGAPALVMELVEGSTLADRIARGALPLDETLTIAKQIAEGLEAAHEQGIIHRDLKPANIKLRDDGTVKILDFGLAKALEPKQPSGVNVTQSPTLTSPAMMTGVGVLLGTAAYMSPEQAKGRPADKRSDVWAFGCVLYEMLVGKRPFEGDDVSDTLVFILAKDPDWTALPASTPAPIVRLLRRCLEKNSKQRLDSAAAARLDVEDALKPHGVPLLPGSAAATAAPGRRGAYLPWAIVIVSLIVSAAVTALWAPWRSKQAPAAVSFELQADVTGASSPSMFAMSPDGKALVSRISEANGASRLWLRPLDRPGWTPLPGTEGGSFPFWSPDSRYVGFVANRKLKILDVLAPTPQTVVDDVADVFDGKIPDSSSGALGGYSGGTWNRDGVILLGRNIGPIFRVAQSGGRPLPLTELNASQGETSHRFPRFLPDGEHFLYLVTSAKPSTAGIYVGSLSSKSARRIGPGETRADFAAPDLLLFLRDSTLMAQRFDLRQLDVVGEPVQVATSVFGSEFVGSGGFSASENGVLAVRKAVSIANRRQLIWMDVSGKVEGTVEAGTPSAYYENPRLSPDGKRLAVFRPENGGDIWITDLESSRSTRLTFDPAVDNIPVWSPDGRWIAFSSNRGGDVFNVYRKNGSGTGADELLLQTPRNKLVNDWHGNVLLYQESSPQTGSDVWMLPLSGDKKPTLLLGGPFNESDATLSPDGRWLAYVSDETGARQVYVQTFPQLDNKVPISNSQFSSHPRWRQDGKQLFFDASGTLSVVEVLPSADGAFKAGPPHRMFQGLMDISPHNFDVAEMGRRFLVVMSSRPESGTLPIVVTVNWMSGLGAR